MTYQKSDIWIAGGLLTFCLFAAWRTLSIPSVGTGTSAGPDFVPWLMIGAIVLLSLIMIARSALAAKSVPASADAASPKTDNSPDDQNGVVDSGATCSTLLRIAIFVVILIAYAALFMTLGYLVTTIAVFISGMFLLGERRFIPLILVPIAITAAIYFGFTEFLNVWLP